MSNKKTSPSKYDFIESDQQFELVPRRRFERRKNTIPSDKQHEATKFHERRQHERRSSRPALLSVEEIAGLRKE